MIRSSLSEPDAQAAEVAQRPPDLAGPANLDPRGVLALQRQIGNAAVARLVREETFKEKIEALTGGLTDLTLDVTFSVAESKANTIQCVQAWWGSGSTLGFKVGKTPIKIGEKEYEAFIDGGKHSPYVTLSGNKPAHATQPYYLTAAEHKAQVKWTGEAGTIQITDLPSASAYFEEMHFETAIVGVDVDGKGTDRILKMFTWGSTKQGTVQQHDKGDKIANKDSHIVTSATPSATFKQILKNDYPDYKYT